MRLRGSRLSAAEADARASYQLKALERRLDGHSGKTGLMRWVGRDD